MATERDFEWFPFYPADFLNSPSVKRLYPQEVGWYVLLLCYEWIDGPLPADPEELALRCGTDSEAIATSWPRLGRCFKKTEDGQHYINPRLEEIRAEQNMKRRKLSKAGSKGAKSMWGKRKGAHGQAMAKPKPGQGQAMRSHGIEKEKEKESRDTTPPIAPPAGGKVEYPPEFEELWKAYPSRGDSGNPKKRAFKDYQARIREGVTHEQLLGAVIQYGRHCKEKGNVGTEYVMHGKTFFSGQGECWREWWEKFEKSEEARKRWEAQRAQTDESAPEGEPVDEVELEERRQEFRDALAAGLGRKA